MTELTNQQKADFCKIAYEMMLNDEIEPIMSMWNTANDIKNHPEKYRIGNPSEPVFSPIQYKKLNSILSDKDFGYVMSRVS